MDDQEFAFSGAGTSSSGVWWRNGLSWTEGQQVRLYLTVPPPPQRVTGLKALRMDQSVMLTWDDLSSVPAWGWIAKMQYQQQSRGTGGWGDWGDWTDIGLVGSKTISDLTNGTVYNFRVRAVGPGGEGRSSRAVKAKPTAKPAPPTGLIANAADGSVILHWDTHQDYSTWEDDNAKWQYRERNETGNGQLVAQRGREREHHRDQCETDIARARGRPQVLHGDRAGQRYRLRLPGARPQQRRLEQGRQRWSHLRHAGRRRRVRRKG